MTSRINIIDLFAGPGGLGEGFSAFVKNSSDGSGASPFKIRMSVEKEPSAHQTLTLRAFYRILKERNDTSAYFEYTQGILEKKEMINRFPDEWEEACRETLDRPTALGEDNETIHHRLNELKEQYSGESWIVIGGPPCQAYSLVGRARNKGIKGYEAETDLRHFLYQEYLKVLSIIQPDVFVMENVKGILSSQVDGERIFPTIRRDLSNPSIACGDFSGGNEYNIYSFVKAPDDEEQKYKDDHDYIIRAEKYGIPQARHRVILLGVAKKIKREPEYLQKQKMIPIEHVLHGLPVLRSKLSKKKDSPEAWKEVLQEQISSMSNELKEMNHTVLLKKLIDTKKLLKYDSPALSRIYPEERFSNCLPVNLRNWYSINCPEYVLNHAARSHMESDLGRYIFSACWALIYGDYDKPFPKSEDYPEVLAPNHANWNTGKFADRFRVQRYGRPATTVTSHISKDGHYFIHPDARQCRSLTVREAARIQTFPDNYFFEGNRTQQYVQVGNAVPPYLAVQLAEVVFKLFKV
ncbi:DNA cytosine methyltransferase [Oceanobacter sp. 4_MG-2023]|uniref:DNA cytosine methyltransferase n=1 Tax=Oceanobacter sp. 4_MG-2023 TaxID=3062623 RepID=UPI0027370A7D|nr:DNA cytosine methyltransferase [Oceanobacter sp. 4_MG-2023]MDP2546902.1 DNA cytosine methyltransferase [Oceanobacter sp. 4_MG-2023]